MIPSEEFRKRASECEAMARFTRDPGSRDVWRRMAARWLRCAETFSNETLAARPSPTKHRHPAPAWARH